MGVGRAVAENGLAGEDLLVAATLIIGDGQLDREGA
jgi:hypothetical protein